MEFGSEKSSLKISETPVENILEIKNILSKKLTSEELKLFNSKDILSSLDDDSKEALLNTIKTIPGFAKEIIANINNFSDRNSKDIIENLIKKQKETRTGREGNLTGREGNLTGREKKIQSEIKEITEKLLTELNIINHPNYKNWKEKAESDLGQNEDFQKLSEGEKINYLNTYILLENRSSLEAQRPDLKDDFDKLAGLAKSDTLFRGQKIGESLKSNPQILKRDLDFAKYSLIGKGDVDISGNKIKVSNDSGETETIILDDKGPPKKIIEKYGYQIDTSQKFPTEYQYQETKENLKQKAHENYSKLNTENKEKLNNFSEKGINETIKYNLDSLNSKTEELKIIEEQVSNLEIEEQIESYEKINDIKKEIDNINKEIKIFQELKQIRIEATQIEKTEQKRIGNFREGQINKDKEAINTLEFLKNIGLTFIPQNELQKIINIINQNPANYGFDEKIDLNNGLQSKTGDINSQKSALTERMNKIYEKTGEKIDTEALIQGKNNPYINDPTQFMGGLEKAGIYKNGIFQSETFKELFLGKREGGLNNYNKNILPNNTKEEEKTTK